MGGQASDAADLWRDDKAQWMKSTVSWCSPRMRPAL
jgi:hypothetical protein